MYCTDAPNFSCINAYGLSSPVTVWTCDDGGGGGNPIDMPQLFIDYPWLDGVVDRSDCGVTYVDVYRSGNFLYFFVDTGDGLLTMYNEAGLFYCQEVSGFSCLSAYGITNSDFIERWQCQSLIGKEVEGRERKAATKNNIDLSVYPNPTTGMITISTDLVDYEIQLYNMDGQRQAIGFRSESEIDMTDLSSGVYVIVIKSGITTLTRRVVKL